MKRSLLILVLLAPPLAGGPAAAREGLTVVRVSPARHALAAPAGSSITVEFDRPVFAGSVTPASFWAFGRWSGVAAGSFRFADGGRVVTLIPERRFSAGESVMVILSRDLRAMDGSFLRDAGYSFQFWTRSRGAGFDFRSNGRLSTRSASGVTTRAYGGFASDLDGDGFLDLTIVNEDTDDLRTFVNRADRSGRFRDFLRPPAATGAVPSPSEPADFDRDGLVDVVVANTRDDSVSVLLGRGDGSFAAADSYFVGGEPRGVAVLDADGDGDLDIAATSFADGRVTVLHNDGGGRFGGARRFGNGGGERAIAAGDMNDDGILDLVVGLLSEQRIHLYTGTGDGRFTLAAEQASGGEVWMLVLGDVDGDGDEDVAAVNSRTDNAAILLGDGRGGLAAPRTVATDPFPLATDLADLDGDGDLDWVTSSFDGDWMLWANDGRGQFTHRLSFPAPQAASCSLALDVDNDGVLDLALVDELADEVVLMRSRAVLLAADFESGDLASWSRARGAVTVVAPGLRRSDHALEVPVDGTRSRHFVQSRHPRRESGLVVELDLDLAGLGAIGEAIEILRLGGGRGQSVLTLESDGSRYRVRLWARDAAGWREVGSTRVRTAGPVRLGVEWSSASGRALADGRVALTRGGRLEVAITDLANHGRVINRMRLGLPGGSEGAAPGSFLVDGFLATR